jgi:hypothetical protein
MNEKANLCRGAAGASTSRGRNVRVRVPVVTHLLAVSLLLQGHAIVSAAEPLASPNILELQASRQEMTLAIGGTGAHGSATLSNLNPRINRWYVLALDWQGKEGATYFHVENPAPLHQTLLLDRDTRRGLLVRTDLDEFACELWSARAAEPLEQARRSGLSYASLCDGRLYLRNQSTGYRTTRELVTEFLRDRVWGGEKIIGIVKDRLARDAHLESSSARPTAAQIAESAKGPLPALMDAAQSGLRPLPAGLGIELDAPTRGGVAFGQWYAAKAASGAYISVMQAGLSAASRLTGYRDRVKPLDSIESSAIVYLAAFDLADHLLGFEVGTDHPRVGWSERSLPQVRDSELRGPDGIDSIAPLVATGIVNPLDVSRTIATFTGGFKRSHGAFRYGELSQKRRGSHYGWVQNGVVFSSLQPGLATLLVRDTGKVEMLTWQAGDERSLAGIAHARQNGVPIIESLAASGEAVPGSLVGNWGAGNWSGSAEGEQRTVRGGICLQDSEAGRFLIYGYFSSVTPSAMARVFQAYQCEYAMLLDMNALEHTYLALYRVEDSAIKVQHLVKGMEAVDRTVRGVSVPRFLGYPDNRDFFYVLKRQENEP